MTSNLVLVNTFYFDTKTFFRANTKADKETITQIFSKVTYRPRLPLAFPFMYSDNYGGSFCVAS